MEKNCKELDYSKSNKKDPRRGHNPVCINVYQAFGYGGGGIRTHGALADTLVFKTRALNHSTTPPGEKFLILNLIIIAKEG